jgi:predicted transcriptional regulator
MSKTVKVTVGTTLKDDLKAVAEAWKRAERGDEVQYHVVSFETFKAMAAVLTPERLRLLRRLRAHPARSVRALSHDLHRDYSRVHRDVAALEGAGLIERDTEGMRTTADKVQVEVDLAAAS